MTFGLVISFLFIAAYAAIMYCYVLRPNRESSERLKEARYRLSVVDTLSPPTKELSVSLKPKNSKNCPLCREIIDSCVWYCSNCLTLYHIDCLEEMSPEKCPTTGCENKFLELRSFAKRIKA